MSEPTQAYPLAWPISRKRTPERDRKSANFGKKRSGNWGMDRLTVATAIRRLRQEVSAFTRTGHTWVINPATLVLSTNVPVRNDGMPYSTAREPDDPGVAVYFELRGKPHCVTCDRWNRVADNIGAIAKHLEAIRGIERWGTANVEALFAGFKALPPGGNSVGATAEPTAFTVPSAALFIAMSAGVSDAKGIVEKVDVFKAVYRQAIHNHHPDANGGKASDTWHRLQAAYDVMKRHHNL